MGIDGLSEVPAPPAIGDIYDGLAPGEIRAGIPDEEPGGVQPARHASVTAAAVIALVLSGYGLWIGIASLRSWFLFSPFCDADCRVGVAYGALLLLPAAWGCVLAGGLLRRRRWTRVGGAATFALFALENIVRLEPRIILDARLTAPAFRYQVLYAAMAILNVTALALVLGKSARLDLERPGPGEGMIADQVEALAARESAEGDGDSGLGLDRQVGAALSKPGPGASTQPRPTRPSPATIGAAALLMAVLAWYRIPDSLLHWDLAGVFAADRTRIVPRWLAASPAVAVALGWGFLLAFGLLFRRSWARRYSVATCAFFVVGLLPLAGLCIGARCFRTRDGLELAGLLIGNVAVVVLLLTRSARRDFARGGASG